MKSDLLSKNNFTHWCLGVIESFWGVEVGIVFGLILIKTVDCPEYSINIFIALWILINSIVFTIRFSLKKQAKKYRKKLLRGDYNE